MQKCLHDVFNLGLRLQELNPQSIVFVINLLSRAVVSQLAMNVLEHIECELSAESDFSVEEDDFNNASEDDDYRELSHESDIMANSSSSSTSRSTCLESASNSSSSTSRSSAVSLLSVLQLYLTYLVSEKSPEIPHQLVTVILCASKLNC